MISVIIPYYKAEKTIGATLNSFLAQKDVDLEVLVVVDSKDDGAFEILNQKTTPPSLKSSMAEAGQQPIKPCHMTIRLKSMKDMIP